ncbi:FUSC family protein [Gordonia sp. DT218]|uniref:FUSC family protein n=1 Tax=unclassified Gordonia (in: high G+C Gram-positive bacteria) TaxID=2657482 RepID=UPI003CF9E1E2
MSTGTLGDHVRHRQSALVHAVHPSVWRSSVSTFDMSRAGVAAPIRVGIAVAIVLVVSGLLGCRDVAGFAALGAVTSAFCRPDPYRVRVGRLGVLGIGIVAAVGIGAALGLTDASITVQIATISILGGCAALLVGTLRMAGPGAIIFVFAATGSMGFVDSASDLRRTLTATVIGAVCGAVASLAPWLLRGTWSRIRPTQLRPTTDNTPVQYESLWTTLTRRPRHDLVANSLRIVVAMAASAAIATAAGLSHPMWAAMGAIAAMQGVSYHVTVQRGVQRLLGNVGGAIIAVVLLGLGINYWGAVVVIVICQLAAEITAPVNYAVASVAVTPMALLLTGLSADLPPSAALDRVTDTLIGVVIGIVVAALTITAPDVGRLRQPAKIST